MSFVVVPGPDMSIGEPDEDVRRRIPDAKHFVLGHASMRPGGRGAALGTHRWRHRDFGPPGPPCAGTVDARPSHSGDSRSDSQSTSRSRPRRPAAAIELRPSPGVGHFVDDQFGLRVLRVAEERRRTRARSRWPSAGTR